MNHEDSIRQRAEMRRGEHPNGTYDAVPLPPLIGTPEPGFCPRHGGPWGGDGTCPNCTNLDGTPKEQK